MNNITDVIDVLQEAAIFRNIDAKRLKLVAYLGQTLEYHVGERLFERGDEGDAVFVVLEGEVEVIVPTAAGEAPVAVLGKYEIFGEMGVFSDQARSAAIQAKTKATVLRLEKTALLGLLQEFPDVALDVIKVLAKRLDATNQQLAAARIS